MTRTNRMVVSAILDAIDGFVAGELDIPDIQVRLQSGLGILERGLDDVSSAIRIAEADLEEIQFTMLLDEWRPAVVFRLDSLRGQLSAALADAEQ
ncbi:MAG: hypothetical protein ACRDPW_00470 [Mycobacteriales bacterium]